MAERRTPFYDIHKRLGAELVKAGGDYMLPLSFQSPVEEHVNTRTNAGVQDLSSMGEVDVKGPGAERLINQLLVNDVRDMEPGRLRYSTMCNSDGGVVDDITVYKFHDEHFMVVASSGPRKKSAAWIREHAVGTSTYVTDISGAVALLSVQGPRSRDLLKTVVHGADLDALKFFRFTTGRIGEIEVTVSRSGYTGELGFELYLPAEEAGVAWERLAAAGRDFGLAPYGVTAMQTLRVEKGYPLYGNDVNERYTPFHVGLDRWVKFSKREFVGRDALLRVQERGPDERWVGLVLDSEVAADVGDTVATIADVAAVKEKIYTGSEAQDYEEEITPSSTPVGHVTVSVKGHSVGRMLAMAYVKPAHAWPGGRLVVSVKGRPRLATVTPPPFFDAQGMRLKA